MRARTCIAVLAVSVLPSLAAAQQSNPVSDAFRQNAASEGKNLVAAFEEMPADKYGFKPTPAQMSFGQIAVHLSEGNDYFCGELAGTKAPTRSKISATDSKDVLVARLKETFAFCDSSLAKLDDSKLSEQLPFFGGRTQSRAAIMTVATVDWADHYSQTAIYLRMNGQLPPTAKRRGPE